MQEGGQVQCCSCLVRLGHPVARDVRVWSPELRSRAKSRRKWYPLHFSNWEKTDQIGKSNMLTYLGMGKINRGLLFKEFSVTGDWGNLIWTNTATATKYYLFLSLISAYQPLASSPAQTDSCKMSVSISVFTNHQFHGERGKVFCQFKLEMSKEWLWWWIACSLWTDCYGCGDGESQD